MRNLFTFFILIFALNFYAQKEANFWYFGENAGLDFSSGEPKTLNNGKLSTDEGCSSISNSDGDLLFYSDGITLYNSNHEIMTFSDGRLATSLEGNPSSTQSALFVPNPTNKNIYYLFTVGTNFVGNTSYPVNPGFNFYTIDLSLNGGLGEVTSGPVSLDVNPNNGQNLSSFWSEKVTAVQGSCGSIWALSVVENQFFAYEITSAGVDINNPVISRVNYTLIDKRGYLKVSPDGSKIAMADYNEGFGSFGAGSLVLLDFDINTGKVNSNIKKLTDPNKDGAPYGVEFSQQSNKLYVSTFNTQNNIYQFDLTKTDIANTKVLISSQTGFRSGLQLAPNGKIYNSIPGNRFLGAIENPDDTGSEVTYINNAINLGTSRATQGLPPFIQSFFKPIDIVDVKDSSIVLSNSKQNVCADQSLKLEPKLEEEALGTYNYVWTKEEDTSIRITTRELELTNTNYGSGKYNLEIKTTDSCGNDKTYNSSVEVEFQSIPTINNSIIYSQCDYDTNSLDGKTFFNLETKEIELSNNATDVSVEFFELDDTPISNKVGYVNKEAAITNSHILKVKVTNNTTGCSVFGQIELKVTPTTSGFNQLKNIYKAEINASTDLTNYSEGSNDAAFNLDEKIDKVISNSSGVFNRSEYQFKYYLTSEDAAKETNEITAPYTANKYGNNTRIYLRISKGNTCEGIAEFSLFVNKLPEPLNTINPNIICLNFPDNSPVLETKSILSETGNSIDSYKWYLNSVEIPNETNSSLTINKGGDYKVIINRFYENEPGNEDDIETTGYKTFSVLESSIAENISIKYIDNQDEGFNNSITINVEGLGDYEYALNNNSLTEFKKGDTNLSYTFTNVPTGLNKIYIRDRNECGIVNTNEISFIYFQRHFTPNGDGVNDTWNISGIDNNFYTDVDLQIFDRFGKVLKIIDLKTETGWNGTYNGKLLPTNDYWYNAVLKDVNGNIRKQTGHFSLLRK